jgi:hypothetical protein
LPESVGLTVTSYSSFCGCSPARNDTVRCGCKRYERDKIDTCMYWCMIVANKTLRGTQRTHHCEVESHTLLVCDHNVMLHMYLVSAMIMICPMVCVYIRHSRTN